MSSYIYYTSLSRAQEYLERVTQDVSIVRDYLARIDAGEIDIGLEGKVEAMQSLKLLEIAEVGAKALSVLSETDRVKAELRHTLRERDVGRQQYQSYQERDKKLHDEAEEHGKRLHELGQEREAQIEANWKRLKVT